MKIHKSNYQIYLIVLNAALGSLFAGYQYGIYNPCQDSIAYKNKLIGSPDREFYEGLITGVIPLSGMIASCVASNLLQYGRKNAMMITDIISIIGIIVLQLQSINMLLLGRLIVGLSVGFNFVIVPIYIKEISPISISGICGSFHQFMICLGILFAFFLGFQMPSHVELEQGIGLDIWKILFLFSLIPCILRLFMLQFCFNFDTPLYLGQNNQYEEISKILNYIYKKEFIQSQTMQIKMQVDSSLESQNKSTSQFSEYLNLISPQYKQQMLIGVMVMVAQQLCGINAVIFYSNKIFQSTLSEFWANVFTVFVGIILMLSALASGNIIDLLGRRQLFLLGDFVCIASIFMISALKILNFGLLNNFFILVFITGFGLSLGPIATVYISEILPDKGMSITILVNLFFTFLIGFYFPKFANSWLQIEGTFLIFGVISIFCFIFLHKNMKETKGKSHEEIQKMFISGYVNVEFQESQNILKIV